MRGVLSRHAEMGIGTLIIFISLLLVAAIAAGVLVQTSGKFRESARSVESAGTDVVSAGLEVNEVSATDGMDGKLEDFSNLYTLSPGAEPISLSGVTFTQSLNDYSSTLQYREGGDAINDIFTGYFTATDYAFPKSTDAFPEPVPAEFRSTFSYPRTSDAMVGKIAVAIVMPESNGSIDSNNENWTRAEEEHVIGSTRDALNWWSDVVPRAGIRHTFEVYRGVETSYEPIERDLTEGERHLWINETIDALGFPEGGDTYSRIRQFASDLRERKNAHWSYVLFVADGSNHANLGFGGTSTAGIGMLGGPYAVVGTDIKDLPALIAHESAHVFRALDEYQSACSCDQSSGLFAIENGNCEEGCVTNKTSIMRGGSETVTAYRQGAVSEFVLGQMSMLDTDGNNLVAPVDEFFEEESDEEMTNETVRELAQEGYRSPPQPVGYFSVDYLKQGDASRDGLLRQSDLVELNYEAPRPVGTGEEVSCRFLPTTGTQTTTRFVTPDVITSKRMKLYPLK